MAFGNDKGISLDRLDEALQVAVEPTLELFSEIIGGTCRRIPVIGRSGNATRFVRLLESGGWTDAALALIDLEQPAWKLRRLICEDGEWFCSLSRHPGLPLELDDTVDASHEVLPLAVLRAFLAASRRTVPEIVSTVPTIQAAADRMICCDNFA